MLKHSHSATENHTRKPGLVISLSPLQPTWQPNVRLRACDLLELGLAQMVEQPVPLCCHHGLTQAMQPAPVASGTAINGTTTNFTTSVHTCFFNRLGGTRRSTDSAKNDPLAGGACSVTGGSSRSAELIPFAENLSADSGNWAGASSSSAATRRGTSSPLSSAFATTGVLLPSTASASRASSCGTLSACHGRSEGNNCT